MHTIDEYRFGHIKIDGTTYDFDLILTPDEIITDWWRKDGHKLHLADLEKIFPLSPSKLILGQGASGRMKVPQDVTRKLEKKGFEVISEKTKKATEIYNSVSKNEKVIGAFHLTC